MRFKMSYDIIIIGGGASGLVSAIAAARKGAKVLIFDRMSKIGKKILATGNGKCNFTNLDMKPCYYRGEDMGICHTVLKHFSEEEAIRFFKELGILPKIKQGYVYPFSEQASAVLDALQLALTYLQVNINTGEEILEIIKQSNGYVIKSANHTYHSPKVILATGGMASEKLGSNGSGYLLAEKLGHHLIKPVPALTGLKCKGNIFKELAGIRMEARLTLYLDQKLVCSEQGELQLTHYGISGIPTFQMSRYGAYGLERKQEVIVNLDLLPELSDNDINAYMISQMNTMPYKQLGQLFLGLMNHKLNHVLIKIIGLNPRNTIDTLTRRECHKLSRLIKEFSVSIVDTNGFANAQVTAGGISTKEINDLTMESKLCKNLFIVGELLDIDGRCGGYNLQWAWATGYIAGDYAGGNE